MKAIGIDIGTTSICAVLLDCETGKLLETETLANASAFTPPEGNGSERLQDPKEIIETVKKLKVLDYDDVSSIGVTGQMHGILYLDADGEPVSPLYTWQDGRGGLPRKDGYTYAEYLTKKTGRRLATGFGLVTHFYNLENNLVPNGTKTLCTIGDYVALAVCGAKKTKMHPTNAHSIGFYDISTGFDTTALEGLGVDTAILPEIAKDGDIIGKTASGASVAAATGDNQASVLGAAGLDGKIVANVGTGSQISVITPYSEVIGREYGENIEIRPYFEDKVLFVGSALMGGDSYALLERFFAKTAEMLGLPAKSVYPEMDAWLETHLSENSGLFVDTRFKGTRADPGIRGAIQGIDATNLTPENLMRGFLAGIAEELWRLYAEMPDAGCDFITGAGNGLRKNKYLIKVFEERFGKKVRVPLYEEEAACGAALFAAGK